MAMAVGGSKDHVADINMTPMIDVLLVLLVIFMIAQPTLQKSVDMQIPEEKEEQAVSNPAPQIVLEIAADGAMNVNTRPVTMSELSQFLTDLYATRPDKAMMIKADPEVLYQTVISAMDIARGAGVEVMGAMGLGNTPGS